MPRVPGKALNALIAYSTASRANSALRIELALIGHFAPLDWHERCLDIA